MIYCCKLFGSGSSIDGGSIISSGIDIDIGIGINSVSSVSSIGWATILWQCWIVDVYSSVMLIGIFMVVVYISSIC
jgi:hypothetical protein